VTSDALAARLAAAGVRVERDVPVAELTTYHVGGPVAVLARVGTATELARVADALAGDVFPPLLVVGRGSNLLVADTGFAGLGLVLDGAFDALDLAVAPASVRAGAAVALPVLARRAAGAGRTGLEFFVGIPGSVGGAVRMNAGGHGRETADVLLEAEVADLSERLETRKAVDRAKGVLQQRLDLSEPDAFRWIQKTAMDLRLSMRQVADGVITHGPEIAEGSDQN
jgi:UDP-N-acetylmuramate dehydrogenase